MDESRHFISGDLFSLDDSLSARKETPMPDTEALDLGLDDAPEATGDAASRSAYTGADAGEAEQIPPLDDPDALEAGKRGYESYVSAMAARSWGASEASTGGRMGPSAASVMRQPRGGWSAVASGAAAGAEGTAGAASATVTTGATVTAGAATGSPSPRVRAPHSSHAGVHASGAMPLDDFDPRSIPETGYRWAWVEVDMNAIRHNVSEVRKRLDDKTRLLAVVKADGYGHGAVQCAKIALRTGASWLAVATVPEGIELREAGIDAPILLLSEPPRDCIPALVAFDIAPAVYTVDFAIALGEYAASQGTRADFYLAINTGMNRIGVWYADVVEFVRSISFHAGLCQQGTFTHFATADAHDDYAFRLQLRRFSEAVAAIREAGVDPGIVHAANSAAAVRYREAHFDMVRLGIAMYGLHPSNATHGNIELWPAMSVKARITALNDVPVGEGVGYGMNYRSPGNVMIGVIPIGYADGLSRQLSGRMSVIYKGRLCPQVGNICMDQSMFEIDKRSTLLNPAIHPELGDEVIVIGRAGEVYLHLDEMADALGTINYELACRFGMRMPRVYI